jgi:7-cyano-7-deazaguanine synthase
MAKIITLLSGGLDSSTLLYELKHYGHRLHALSFDYGQRHLRELKSAQDVARTAGISWEIANLSGIVPLLGGSSQTDFTVDVPEGHYTDESMKVTVVPNRNMIMASVAVARAISLGFDAIALAVHAGDHAIYPDCRPEFVGALVRILQHCHSEPIGVYAPYSQHTTKEEIVRLGHTHNVPFKLTWSCYKGGDKHCGKCGTCVERREAFQLAHVTDPTEYEDATATH